MTFSLSVLFVILLSFVYIDDDFDGGVDEALDLKGLSKRDMHTLNEQRRRDSIKVRITCVLWQTFSGISLYDWIHLYVSQTGIVDKPILYTLYMYMYMRESSKGLSSMIIPKSRGIPPSIYTCTCWLRHSQHIELQKAGPPRYMYLVLRAGEHHVDRAV